ncbi:MAG: pantetheine-phosphate adenylyltransferase [Muribaculaceae bacterium]|nr:pantetheine-phosphate adenylyltransferase [Muribaculaceae bacterium]
MNSSIAIFPGSFNPFTTGHLDIVERALKIFDKVIVAVGINIEKQQISPIDSDPEDFNVPQNVKEIELLFENYSRVEVMTYYGLTADLVKRTGATCIIRGIRNSADFEYEKKLSDVNLEVLGVETLLFPCRPSLSFVSSSMIRELKHFNINPGNWIPKL